MLRGVPTKAFPSFGQLFRTFSVILRFPLFLLLIVAIVLLLLCEMRESLDTFFFVFLPRHLLHFS